MPWKIEPKNRCAKCGGSCSRRSIHCKRHQRNGPKPKPPKLCPDCGTAPRSWGCSRCRACSYIARKSKTRKPRPCKQCGTQFWPLATLRTSGSFCSLKCVHAWMRAHAFVEVICEQCGAKVQRRASARKRHRTFCSLACSGVFFSGRESFMFRGGRERGRGKGWERRAEEIRKRDGYQCLRCGKSQQENGRRLSVDHIIPWRCFTDDQKDLANDHKNLASLCIGCHSQKTSRAEQKWLRGDRLDFKAYERALALPSAATFAADKRAAHSIFL